MTHLPTTRLSHSLHAQPQGLSVTSEENDENSHRSRKPTILCDWGDLNLYLDQPIAKGDASQLEAISHYPQTVLMPPS